MRKRFFRKRGRVNLKKDIDPDEIFLDSQNLPQFDKDQFEGRIEKPVSRRSISLLSFFFLLIFLFLSYKVFDLQVAQGEEYREISENNRLRHSLIFASRGNIYDRNGQLIAWNEPQEEGEDFPKRIYAERDGFSNLIGYIKYPQKDKKGFYYELEYKGIDGAEELFNSTLAGENGKTIVETNALNEIVAENTILNPVQGKSIELSIDLDVQEKLYTSIKEIAEEVGFRGGGGVIMDVNTGEILAMTTYPELNSKKLTEGDEEFLKTINEDSRNPFLNRITQGLYTPGSIIKPFMALAVLNEGVIDEWTNLVSRGELEVPNPYDPDNPTFFSDWKAHGSVDIRRALAVSSNIYFYIVGGGYDDIEGLGITRLERYMRSFGFGRSVEGDVTSNLEGTVPNPQWKAENFDGDIWRLGDTYFTSIGQYGFQVTPIQMVRGIAMIANGGKIFEPKLLKDAQPKVDLEVEGMDPHAFEVVREGMRLAVLEGTAKGLNLNDVQIAGKTGTAELGVTKERVNSWTVGFFPYENPRYAFAVVMEKGSRSNLIGGVAVTRRLFDWILWNKPEYFE
jgi:penicillin-binding protein 2